MAGSLGLQLAGKWNKMGRLPSVHQTEHFILQSETGLPKQNHMLSLFSSGKCIEEDNIPFYYPCLR